MFIAMDEPKHSGQRKVVQPVVALPNLAALEPIIRQRIQQTLDELPWVSLSIGSSACLSSSRPRCWRLYSTSPKNAAS